MDSVPGGLDCMSPEPPQTDDDLTISGPRELVLALLLVQESMQSRGGGVHGLGPLRFFLHRAGGFHLLLSLLSAHYNKRAAGRMPGWTFGVLRERIGISPRALRTLICDAVDLGLAVQLCGKRDQRCKVYCLTERVVQAWEDLYAHVQKALPSILAHCGPSQIADLDFREEVSRMAVPPTARVPQLPQVGRTSTASSRAMSSVPSSRL